MRQYPSVPSHAASHGCVRITDVDARWVYGFVSVGMPVHVISHSV
jgi:lipoprotein-anchoring transpeptidase ErfK/SrfK